MNKSALEDLKEIRSIMERSTRFISLSGLSGIFAGVTALIGAMVAYLYIKNISVQYLLMPYFGYKSSYTFLILDALIVLFVAVSGGIFFTLRKAKKQKQKVWDTSSKRLLFHMAIPLFVGAYICFVLLYHGFIGYIAPITLLFYGLALFSASKYTLHDIMYLAISEIVLGMVAFWFIGYGLLFWSIGFGLLHIVYGIIMYYRYEK